VIKNALYVRSNRVDLLKLTDPDKKDVGAMVLQGHLGANGFLVATILELWWHGYPFYVECSKLMLIKHQIAVQ